MDASPALYQIGTVARILKITRPLAMRLVKAGELPSLRTPQGLRVEHDSLAQWIDGQMQGQSPAHALAKEVQKK
jgi:hypothetical protein